VPFVLIVRLYSQLHHRIYVMNYCHHFLLMISICFSKSIIDSIINCNALLLLYGFCLSSTCLGSKIKHGITCSEDCNAAISPVLSSSRKSLLKMNKDLAYLSEEDWLNFLLIYKFAKNISGLVYFR
jgi:hypothetical protein